MDYFNSFVGTASNTKKKRLEALSNIGVKQIIYKNEIILFLTLLKLYTTKLIISDLQL